MKEMKTAYLSSAYLAPVEYYTKLLAYDKIFIEQHDHYMKQTYRNRCTITGPDGELVLYIPGKYAKLRGLPRSGLPAHVRRNPRLA